MARTEGRRRRIAATLMLAAASCANAEGEPAATPYRPSVSTPATLSEPGWLEMELGVQRVQGGDGLLEAGAGIERSGWAGSLRQQGKW